MAKVNLDLPGNQRGNRDIIEPVVNAKIGKKRGTFGSDVRMITSSLFEDVVVPAIKSAISDFVTAGMDLYFWGSNSSERHTRRSTNYSRLSTSGRRTERPVRTISQTPSLDDVWFDSRSDAEVVLARMAGIIEQYGFVTIGDVYSMVGITPEPIHERYLWTVLSGSSIQRSRDGYYLTLPKATYDI